MLTRTQYAKYCERLGLSPEGVALLTEIRGSNPERNVRGRRGNVHGRYPSRKMRATIQFESRTNELPRIIFFEHDPAVLEFWDQPNQIKLSYELKSEKGTRKYTTDYTPDFFVIEYASCGWIECKTEQELETLSSKSTRYVKGSDGAWRCPPAEEVAKRYGFFFKVLSSKDINPTLFNNLAYLEDYYHENAPSVPEDIRREVLNVVADNPGILITELKNACPKVRPDHIHSLIASEDIFVDLEKVLLNQPEKVRVYRDSSLASVLIYVDQCPKSDSDPSMCELYEGAQVRIAAKQMTVTAILSEEIVLRECSGKEARISKEMLTYLIHKREAELLSAPPRPTKDLDAFLSRFTIGERTTGLRRFEIYSNPEEFATIKPRTKERWRKRIREAAARWGTSYGWVGLLPTYHNGGRPRGELPSKVVNVLESSFKHWENPAAISFSAFWKLCQNTAHETNTLDMCCKKTARRWLDDRRTRESEMIRDGKAKVNSTAPPLPMNAELPPYAVRPWERVFIDHTMADIRLRLDTDSHDGKTMRPYLTVMVDDYSRKILAFVIDFDPPSRDTCMHLIRECVRLHHYLPGKFALDNGKEFKSEYFQRFMSLCWITPEYRPARTARFGGMGERFFGTANTEMFHQLLGNTKAMKNPRQVTKAVNPETTAVWTLEELYDVISEFCFVIYNDQHVHSTFGCTPNERFKQGLDRHGERAGRKRHYDTTFEKLTFPSTPAGTLTVGRNGIRMFGGFSFWADGMLKVLGEKVPVCYDPDDISKVYVFINKEWVWARCGSHHLLEKMSRRALRIATKEFFAEQKRRAVSEKLNARTLGRFLETIKCKEAIAVQQKIDAQFRRNQEKLAGTDLVKPAGIDLGSEPPANNPPTLRPPTPLKDLTIVAGKEHNSQPTQPAVQISVQSNSESNASENTDEPGSPRVQRNSDSDPHSEENV